MNIKIPNIDIINNHLTEVTIGDIHVFYSYGMVIILKNFSNGKREILLDPVAIGYSKTTDKDRCYILAESIKDTKKKIESGEYKMCNLNDPEFKIELG